MKREERNLEPEKPPTVDKLVKGIKEFRNFYWNHKMEYYLIPEWEDIGRFDG